MKKCKCGETNPQKFYRSHSQCKACTAVYQSKRYQDQKKQKADLIASRVKPNNEKCIECPEMMVGRVDTFKTFCQKRREAKFSGSMLQNCPDCGLGGRVDGGFVPVNISVLKFK